MTEMNDNIARGEADVNDPFALSLAEQHHEAELRWHLDQYYFDRHGKVVSIEKGTNLLGEPCFATVTFADGYRATFQRSEERARNPFLNPWFRNERHVTPGRKLPG